MRRAAEGFSHVILDGKIIPADRCREKVISVKGEVIDLWYSCKAHAQGGNIQAVMAIHSSGSHSPPHDVRT